MTKLAKTKMATLEECLGLYDCVLRLTPGVVALFLEGIPGSKNLYFQR